RAGPFWQRRTETRPRWPRWRRPECSRNQKIQLCSPLCILLRARGLNMSHPGGPAAWLRRDLFVELPPGGAGNVQLVPVLGHGAPGEGAALGGHELAELLVGQGLFLVLPGDELFQQGLGRIGGGGFLPAGTGGAQAAGEEVA